MKTVRCVSGDYEVDSDRVASLADMECSRQPVYTTEVVGTCGQDSRAVLIRIGNNDSLLYFVPLFNNHIPEFDVSNVLTDEGVTISVCHDQEMSSSLWSQHMIFDEIAAKDTGNNRPSFDDEYFDFDVDYYYKMATQAETIQDLTGTDKYIGDQSSQLFLSRGHLSPNADFMFYSWQVKGREC